MFASTYRLKSTCSSDLKLRLYSFLQLDMSIFHLFLASLPARSEYPVFEQEDSYMDEGLFEEEKERSPRPDSKSFDSRLSR